MAITVSLVRCNENCHAVEQRTVWQKTSDTGREIGKVIRGESTLNQRRYKLKVMKYMLPKMPAFWAARRWENRG